MKTFQKILIILIGSCIFPTIMGTLLMFDSHYTFITAFLGTLLIEGICTIIIVLCYLLGKWWNKL